MELVKPGIYINEFDKSSFITEGPSTITGVVGTAPKGPANEIVFVSNYADYVKIFGRDGGYLDFFARFFFKYGGNKLLVVRATDKFNYAGLTVGTDAIYEVDGTLASNDTEIVINYVSGVSVEYLPTSGLIRLDYLDDSEYIIYRELDISSDNIITLRGCHRGLNETTPISISTWGISVTPNNTTNRFTSATPHGLQNGQKVRFSGTGGGVSTNTDYWVINKTSTTFQITQVNGSLQPVNLTNTTSNTVLKYPVPTKYVYFISPNPVANVSSISNEDPSIITLDGFKYGSFTRGDKVKFADVNETELTITSIIEKYNPYTNTQTIKLNTEVPDGVSDTLVCLVKDPFYGGHGLHTFPKFTNYDEWNKPKYDESRTFIEKGAGVSDPDTSEVFMNIYARSCGAWANDDVRISVYNYNSWHSTVKVPYFKNKIENVPGSLDEILIVVESNSTGQIEESWLVSLIPTKTDYWGKIMFITDVINTNSNWIRVYVNPNYIVTSNGVYNNFNSISYLPASFERYYLDGGTNGDVSAMIDSGVYIAPQVREYKILAGYDLFANKNEVDVDIISTGGNQSLAVQTNIKAICEARRDCVGILNIPWGLSINDAIRYKNLIGSSSYTAIYCNGSKVLDAFTGALVSLPPAIQVTPLIVKTDLIKEPWYATAGYNRGMLNEVVELEQEISDGEFELLYANGINPIINDGIGPVIFGIKTMYAGSSAFSKLPIRRLMLKMEKDIKNSIKGYLMEPNNFDTRIRITRTIESYLDSIRARDGIEDYRVICDNSNNNSQTIAAGQIIVDIYIKPIFTAEYIIFNFIVTKDDISSVINNK